MKTYKNFNQFKYYILLLNLLCFFSLNLFADNELSDHGLGAKLLSKEEYKKLPKVNWDFIRSNLSIEARTKALSINNSVMLNNPPIGNQGTQNSCVGWAVGYAALGILSYNKYGSWDIAKRSPNFIYNQTKLNQNCNSGTYTINGLNFAQSNGDCSWSLMPYDANSCSAMPNDYQGFDASLNKLINWATLSPNDVTGIKQALDYGLPVVVVFVINYSFTHIWNYAGGIWDYNFNNGNLGHHAVCIVGYDDNLQMFKVQNSWGSSGGDQGYFWVTYNLVQNNCFSEVYVVGPLDQAVYPTISGPSQICDQGVYTINNLPNGATVNWRSGDPFIFDVQSGQGTPIATFNLFSLDVSGYEDQVIADITYNGYTLSISKNVMMGSAIPSPFLTYYDMSTWSIIVSNNLLTGTYYKFVVDDNPRDIDSTNYRWEIIPPDNIPNVDPQFILLDNGYEVSYMGRIPGNYKVLLRHFGECGWSNPQTKIFTISGDIINDQFSIYPNPATDILNISINSQVLTTTDVNSMDAMSSDSICFSTFNSEPYVIKIYNAFLGLVKKVKCDENTKQISVQELPRGTYYIHLLKNDRVLQKKIVWLK